MSYIKYFKIFCFAFIITYLTAICQESPPAQKKTPNYDFSLDNLRVFFPNSPLEDIEKKAGKGTLIKSNGDLIIKKYYVAQLRYKFPVFVQFYQNQSVEFFARLPTYFLHDLFHQALINRYGKQNRYIRIENSALYIWKNAQNNLIVYNGMCTITCFPQFLSVAKTETQAMDNYRPLLDLFWSPIPPPEEEKEEE